MRGAKLQATLDVLRRIGPATVGRVMLEMPDVGRELITVRLARLVVHGEAVVRKRPAKHGSRDVLVYQCADARNAALAKAIEALRVAEAQFANAGLRRQMREAREAMESV